MYEARVRLVRRLLGALLALLVIALVAGDKPWSEGLVERIADGHPPRPIDYARYYRWWIALANAALLAGLLATARRWAGAPDPAPCADLAPSPEGRRWLWVGVLVAVALGAWMTWPRMSLSFWDDEQYTVRRSVDGLYVLQADGEVRFREVRSRDTWLYTLNRPNNHVPFSLAARASLAGWRALARPELRFADEAAVRLPAWLFGMGAIAAAGFLLGRMGMPRAGVAAALCLALHPWAIRYASEARGYSLLLLCIPLLCAALLEVLRTGRWRAWVALGGVQVLLLWVYPGGAAILGVANAALVVETWRRRRGSAALRDQLTRWAVASALAAGLFMTLMGPNLFMFLFHIEWDRDVLDARFLREVASHLLAGVAWGVRRFQEHYVEGRDLLAATPRLFGAIVWTSCAAAALGALRLCRRPGGWVIACVLVLPAPLTLVGVALRETLIHEWYVIFALPSVAILVCTGADAVFAGVRPPRLAGSLSATLLAALLAGHAVLTAPVRHALRTRSVQPTREAVLLTRPHLDPHSRENREILTVSWARTPFYYDPNVRKIGTAEQLHQLMAEADRSGRPLYVNVGRPHQAIKRHPDLKALVERRDLFEPVATLYGFEPRGHMEIHRYRGR